MSWVTERAQERADEYLMLLRHGETPARAAERLGVSPRTQARWFQRRGRYDLAGPLESVYRKAGRGAPERVETWKYDLEGRVIQ